MLTAKALLDEHPKASDEQIRDAMSNVLCRCFAHTRMMRAIQRYQTGARMKREISRRDFVKGSGALVVSFSAASFLGAIRHGAGALRYAFVAC